jgi:hypothetical protein
VSTAIGVEATLIVAGVVPMVGTAALFFVARLRGDEERHPLVQAVGGIDAAPALSAGATGAARQ